MKSNSIVKLVHCLHIKKKIRYLYTGEYSGSGRPAHFAGKVKLKDLDSEVFTQVDINENTQAFYA